MPRAGVIGQALRRAGLALLATGGLTVAASGQTEPPAGRVGPSFACPTPRDALGQLICASPALSRRDLEFVQAYQALRQQSPPAQQAALRAEAAEFGRSVRAGCGIGTPDGARDGAAADAPACVEREYGRKRAAWAARLDRPAGQEAGRPLDQQIALQRDLLRLGLLPQDQAIDGVYAGSTRVAIVAFQQAMGLPATGLIGDADALALVRQAAARDPGPRPSGAAAVPAQDRSAWDDFLARAAAAGVTTTVAASGSCGVTFQVRDPDALAAATRQRPAAATHATDEAARLFAAEMAFLRTDFTAWGVHAFYAAQPAATDGCRFAVAAFTTDLYGRDVAQPLFGFQFDRETYGKIVWSRFDPANMPRIVLSFEYDPYARQRLRGAGEEAADVAQPATPAQTVRAEAGGP